MAQPIDISSPELYNEAKNWSRSPIAAWPIEPIKVDRSDQACVPSRVSAERRSARGEA
jgi:hypothetical protein